MELRVQFLEVDEALASFATLLGSDFVGYRNHIYRVLNFCAALAPGGAALPRAVMLAVPFHDLGIWTAKTFDYLDPSVALAMANLRTIGPEAERADGAAVEAVIRHHHQLHAYAGPFQAAVELYRRADWIDVSLGLLRFGLPRAHVRAVRARWPDAGFHARLAALTARQFLRTPWRPLPMLRW